MCNKASLVWLKEDKIWNVTSVVTAFFFFLYPGLKEFSFIFFLDSGELDGYFLRNISPVKKGNYFDLRLVSKSNSRRAVCFAIKRYKEFRKYQLKKSPVKIKHFRLSNTGNDDILMNKKTTLEVQMKVDNFTTIELDKETILPISQLDKLYSDQIVFLKGTIKYLSSTKKMCIRDETVDKVDLMVVNPTGSIKVTLWGHKCKEDLVIGNTYIFKGFRFKSSKFGNYINSPKTEECSVEKSTSFSEDLAEIDPSQLQEIEEDLILLSVEKTTKSYICSKCLSKIPDKGTSTAKYLQCNNLNKLKNWSCNFYMKLLFKNQRNEKISLSVYHAVVIKLLSLVSKDENHQDLSADDIEMAIVKFDEIKATYNFVQKNLVNATVIA